MASRRRAREFALQALYTAEINDAGTSAGLQSLWSGLLDGEGLEGSRPAESEEIEFAQRIVFGVDEHRASIDELIEQCSTCLLYTSPSPRDVEESHMPSSA